MAMIRKEILVKAPPEQVWDAVRDVGQVHRRLTPGLVSEVRIDGDERTLIFPNGVVVKEWIVAIDNEQRRMAYTVVDGRMQLQHHHASFEVIPKSESACLLVWTTDFLPHAFSAEIGIRMERGAMVMKQALESGLASSV